MAELNESIPTGPPLNLDIIERKESIRGIEGVYLIRPSMENIKQIVDDISGLSYDQVSIHSIYEFPSELMDFLAKELSKRSLHLRIKNITENYLAYTNKIYLILKVFISLGVDIRIGYMLPGFVL